MVSFVQPNVLGDLKSFKRLFLDAITAGQKENATEGAVNFMKRRSYVLQKLLRKCMQRVTNAIYKEVLPPKQEHMLFIRLSKLQMKLYKVHICSLLFSFPYSPLITNCIFNLALHKECVHIFF